jgi:CheY-like chemotaxis protein/HAMP domain-containing protein
MLAGPLVLVVDDEPGILDVVQMYFARQGFRVALAGDGETALAAIEKEIPDLIILDLMLPKMDGLEVCRQLRRTSNVPIIMLTARDEDVDKIVGLELGADDYIFLRLGWLRYLRSRPASGAVHPGKRAAATARRGTLRGAQRAVPGDPTRDHCRSIAGVAGCDDSRRKPGKRVDAPGYCNAWRGAVRAGDFAGIGFPLAGSIARPVTRLTTAAGRMAGGIYDDPPITAGKGELGRLTSAFEAMRQQVRQSQQRERDFLAGVSHDLKTPLAIIQGYASALSDGAASDDASRLRALSGIQRETERMARLIASLLELARLQSGLVPFKLVAVDLAALTRGVLADLSPQAQEKGCILWVRCPPGCLLSRRIRPKLSESC